MDEQKVDSLWKYIDNVYDHMHEAVDEKSVWEGFTTRLMTELGVPVPYYGRILDALQRMGCIDQLQRGGGTAPSRWVLYKKPTQELYLSVRDQMKSRPRAHRANALEQRVADIEGRLKGIDVLKALSDLQVQIDTLKAEAQDAVA